MFTLFKRSGKSEITIIIADIIADSLQYVLRRRHCKESLEGYKNNVLYLGELIGENENDFRLLKEPREVSEEDIWEILISLSKKRSLSKDISNFLGEFNRETALIAFITNWDNINSEVKVVNNLYGGFSEFIIKSLNYNDSDNDRIKEIKNDFDWDDEEWRRRYYLFAYVVLWVHYVIKNNKVSYFLNGLIDDNGDVLIDDNGDVRINDDDLSSIINSSETAKRKCIEHFPLKAWTILTNAGVSEIDIYRRNAEAIKKRKYFWESSMKKYEGAWDISNIESIIFPKRPAWTIISEKKRVLYEQQFYYVFSNKEIYENVKKCLPEELVQDIEKENKMLLFAQKDWAHYNQIEHNKSFEVDITLFLPNKCNVDSQKIRDLVLNRDNYSEFEKVFSISENDLVKIGVEPKPGAHYWIAQPSPKEFLLFYSISDHKIREEIKNNWPGMRVPSAKDLGLQCLSLEKRKRPFEDWIVYWGFQLEHFINLKTKNKNASRVLVVDNEDSQKVAEGYLSRRNLSRRFYVITWEQLIKDTDLFKNEASLSLFLNDVSVLIGDNFEPNRLINTIYHIKSKIHDVNETIIIDPNPILRSFPAKCLDAISINPDKESIRQLLCDGLDDTGDIIKEDVFNWIKSIFKIGELRQIQEIAITKCITYKGYYRNFLTIIPTGGGKSLIFQGPLLYKAIEKKSQKLSIVITPLQALMKDQVKELIGRDPERFKDRVAYLDGNSSIDEQKRVKRLIKEKKLSLLYIAPERFMIRSFYQTVIKKAACEQGIDSIVFDEAHCILGWGMEFRPDYVFALRKCRELQHFHPEIRIQLFTATLPEQAKIELLEEFKNDGVVEFDENNITPGLESGDYIASLCPIRDHIDLKIEKVQDVDTNTKEEQVFEKKMDHLFHLLFENERFWKLLSTKKSRALVFTRTRAEAEQASEWLSEKLSDDSTFDELKDCVAYFHAGLTRKRKDDILKEYESGGILILFATKAFGLGMNIKNIHFVLHLTPPTYIEDYLQEVGRAARDLEIYRSVFRSVFPAEQKVTAYSLFTPSDIEKNKDKIDKIEWDDIVNSFIKIKEYIKSFVSSKTIPNNKYFAVPLDLMDRQDDADNDQEGNHSENEWAEKFQKCLTWLEKKGEGGLARIETGFKCPDAYDVKINRGECCSFLKNDTLKGTPLHHLVKYVQDIGDHGERAIIRANDIISDDRYGIPDLLTLESLIDEGVRCGLFRRDNMYVSVSLKNSSRSFVQKFVEDSENNPLLVLNVICDLLSNNPSVECFDDKLADILKKRLPEEKQEKSRAYIKGLIEKRDKEVWRFFKQLNEIYTIEEIKNKCESLLKKITETKERSVSWSTVESALEAGNDPNMVRLFLYAIYKLNYVEKGHLSTDYLEIKVCNNKDVTTSDDDKREDCLCKKKFNEYYEIQILKAGAMSALIEEFESSDGAKEFIRKYSECLYNNLEENFDPIKRDKKRMSARQQLSKDIKVKLNDEQRAIYNEHLNENIIVNAGAGSGKTRLLTYRALRLILAEHNPERSVLILAYNRAVRDEVENRMKEYAKEIGYTLRNPQIYTFHGFAAKCLPELLEKKTPFSEWEYCLYKDIQNNPKKYSNRFRFILVDEFQDVTQTRLDIIQKLLSFNNNDVYDTRAFLIGDMFQSIYGYERLKDWKNRGKIEVRPSIEPVDYYSQLKNFKQCSLTKNYRSYQSIIDKAVFWFDRMPDKYPQKYGDKTPRLVSMIQDDFNDNRIVVGREGLVWQGDFINDVIPKFLKKRKRWETTKHQKDETNPFTSIGVLFRTNADVHEAYSRIRENPKIKDKFDVRIHGSDIYYPYTREFFFFDKYLDSKGDQLVKCINYQPKENLDDDILDVARKLAEKILHENEGITYSKLREAFRRIVYEERDRLKEYVENDVDTSSCRIILSTIHRIKGMEFDVVVVPASTYPLDLDYDELTPEERNMEERRLMYVAYTRAKKGLYYYTGDREKAILNNESYEGGANKYYAQDGLSAVDISFAAQDDNNRIKFYKGVPDNSFFSINKYISTTVRVGAALMLRRKRNPRDWQGGDEWGIYHGEHLIGNLSRRNKLRSKLNNTNNTDLEEVSGLYVKAIMVTDSVMTEEEKEKAKNNGEEDVGTFRVWSKAAQKEGFVYYIDYYGCAEPVKPKSK